MASVGLLYVGAVLIVNGLMLLGRVEARAAAPLNLFVGGLQVLTPTYLIITSGGDETTILAASGLYLFGFTYLYVGINLLAGLDGTGLGWFSAFVAVAAVVYAGLNFGDRLDDPAFGVIWLYWAVLWALFFLVLGLGRAELTRFTGAVAVVAGVVTCMVPAFLLLTGKWTGYRTEATVALAVVCGLSLLLWVPLRGSGVPAEPARPAPGDQPAGGGSGTPTPRTEAAGPEVVGAASPDRPAAGTTTEPRR
ncbi:AmiS/UreI family transporter [Modestobacter sp. NPDC049651]|uniref:AmiS/UreI family transporter n=1 Tax=unclassified Modestobacter TaxID=2643866 RepID=UPI003406DD02